MLLRSRFNGYPYLDVAHARDRVESWSVAFKETWGAVGWQSDFVTGTREPVPPDGIQGVVQLRHVFMVSENGVLLRRNVRVAEFGGESWHSRHPHAAKVVETARQVEAQSVVHRTHCARNFAERYQPIPLRGNACPVCVREVTAQSRDQHGLAIFKTWRIKWHCCCHRESP